jgi:hypothetical protein
MVRVKHACPEFAQHCDNCLLKVAGSKLVMFSYSQAIFVLLNAAKFFPVRDLCLVRGGAMAAALYIMTTLQALMCCWLMRSRRTSISGCSGSRTLVCCVNMRIICLKLQCGACDRPGIIAILRISFVKSEA